MVLFWDLAIRAYSTHHTPRRTIASQATITFQLIIGWAARLVSPASEWLLAGAAHLARLGMRERDHAIGSQHDRGSDAFFVRYRTDSKLGLQSVSKRLRKRAPFAPGGIIPHQRMGSAYGDRTRFQQFAVLRGLSIRSIGSPDVF